MTRHARRGSKKSTLPAATPWKALKGDNDLLLKGDEEGMYDYTNECNGSGYSAVKHQETLTLPKGT